MSRAYDLIKEEYGDAVAKRSKVPLINHIDEGLKILEYLNADNATKDAYCLHPLFQDNACFFQYKGYNFTGVSTRAIILAVEYRRTANSYLSNMEPESFVGLVCDEIRHMLIADKVQNYKDFCLYHKSTHLRSEELYRYFHKWFELLSINIDTYLTPMFTYVDAIQ